MKPCKMVDCHVHTLYSFDSEAEIGEICADAVRNGLYGFTVTDHCEVCPSGVNEYWSFEQMKNSFDAARAADGKSELRVFAGIELGQPHHEPETARRVLEQCSYDCVLASVHYLRDGSDFYYLDYINEYDPYEVYDAYLKELYETAEMGCYDVIAHITYPLRYIVGRAGVDFDESRFSEAYDAILAEAVRRDKAIEINTAGGRTNHFILPELWLLRRFRELGGKYVTLGSDAHRAYGVGGSFDEGIELAKQAGFDRVVYYEKHIPHEIVI